MAELGADDEIGPLRSLLELLALSAIAVTEPVLSAFRSGADIFVLRRAGAADIVAWTLIVALGPALALWAAELVVRRLAPGRHAPVHGSFLALLTALFVIRIAYEIGDPPRLLLVALAVAVGAGAATVLTRWSPAETWLRVLAVFPVALIVWFLVTTPMATLVFGGNGGEGVGPAPVGNPVPVVMVVLDEFPTASILDDDNRIARNQFPSLARLADDATWFRNHTSVSPSTPQAVPAIVTGRFPESIDALPVTEDHPDNLFTLLEGAYVEHVTEGATRLCPTDLCPDTPLTEESPLRALIDDAATLMVDKLAPTAEQRRGDFEVRQSDPSAPETFARFLAGVSPVGDGDRPRLDFLHLLYPHQPWFHLPSGGEYEAPFVAAGLGDSYAWRTPLTAEAGRQRHLLQAKHADALLGRLLDRLDELDRYDDSLIVVTADHGVSFSADNPIRGLSSANAPEVMWTPLLVKEPDQTDGRIDERPTQTVDILPTIADHLEIDLPYAVDGVSALSSATSTGDDDTRTFTEWSLNTVAPDEGGVSIPVDGQAGYQALLDLPAPGSGRDPDLAFYRYGRHGGLVGRLVVALDQGPPSPLDVTVMGSERFEGVDTRAATLPVYVSGTAPMDVDADLAVSVNGVIGGWAETVDTGESTRREWWVLVPEQLLVDGRNQIEVWEVTPVADGAPGPVTLHPIASG